MPHQLKHGALKKMVAFFLFAFLFWSHTSLAQATDTMPVLQLDSVVVNAYEQNKRLRDVPAAVSYISPVALERFSPASVVLAVNTAPGVRMEERSPGSYRFNIRGSSARSPFGVRNVKVYYNDLPFTDPGGQTYLNQLGYYNFQSMEIIKGPGSSLYGAGTGGVLLIEGMDRQAPAGFTGEYTAGSYAHHNLYGAITTGNETAKSTIGFQHQQSNGYRDHSEMRRDVFSWNGLFSFDGDRALKTTFLYGDLYYQTPGALTLAEHNTNPRMARPGTAVFPSASAAQAAIYQKTFLAGASYTQPITTYLNNKTAVYGAFTELKNPAIRNYGNSKEPHVGGRTVFNFQKAMAASSLSVNAGAEIQQGFSTVSIHQNKSGQPDSLQTLDEISNRQAFVFAQAALDLQDWTFTAGTSINQMKLKFLRLAPQPQPERQRNFKNELAPRFSVMRKFKYLNVYSSVARGFSPPAVTELLPTGSAINLELNAEDGWNYDLGLKGTFFQRVTADVNAFLFHLKNTIVQRRDAGGGEYFVNAGKTQQYGIETNVTYPLGPRAGTRRSQIWLSHTWHHFTYADFKQNANDFSGNQMPGVAPHTVAAGLDFFSQKGLLASVSYLFSDQVPLNDLNSAYAEVYHLAGAKIGFQKSFSKVHLKLMAGADNLLDEKYSLGNDINAAGGRYYNAAAGRNYYATLSFQWTK